MFYRYEVRIGSDKPWEGGFQCLFPDQLRHIGRYLSQSAGAMSVQQLVLSPITRGLFSKAVMSSGGGVSQMLTAKPAETHYPFWKQVMETAGCSTLAEFRALAPAQLFAAWD